MYDEMGQVGILSCGAGPNFNVNVDVVGDVPSTCPGEYLIGVTNTTSADVKYSSAGYGINNIDIGALGQTIMTRSIDGPTTIEIPQGLYFAKLGMSLKNCGRVIFNIKQLYSV